MGRFYLRTAICLRYGDPKKMNNNTNGNNPSSPPIWGFVVPCLIILLAAYGCATTDDYSRGVQDGEKMTIKDIEKEGNMKNSPYAEPYKYIWEPQILQEIIVPAAIRGGVFYPAHKETVIVKPSEPILRPVDR